MPSHQEPILRISLIWVLEQLLLVLRIYIVYRDTFG